MQPEPDQAGTDKASDASSTEASEPGYSAAQDAGARCDQPEGQSPAAPSQRRQRRRAAASAAKRLKLPPHAKGRQPGSSPVKLGNGQGLVAALNQSRLCTEFRQAFSEATGLPVALQPAGSWALPHHGSRYENPFCALMVERSRTCVWCLQSHERLWQAATDGVKSLPCVFGLWETAVAVRLEAEVIGYLHTGQAFRQPPTLTQFERIQRLIAEAAPEVPLEQARALWFSSPVVGPERWDALGVLLRIFGEHLAMVSRQLALQAQYAEPPAITRARQFLEANYGERLSLSAVARVAHMSPFYFCKLFKRITGQNFTDYLSRLRVDKARNLLLNPNLKISEIAFEVGFQSLTHFNRVFKRLTGQAPSQYRRRVPCRPVPEA